MNSSHHSFVASLVFRLARNSYWVGFRGRIEFVVECSGAGCFLGSAEIGLSRCEVISALIYHYSVLINEEDCGRY